MATDPLWDQATDDFSALEPFQVEVSPLETIDLPIVSVVYLPHMSEAQPAVETSTAEIYPIQQLKKCMLMLI